jgi:hypothetical protein
LHLVSKCKRNCNQRLTTRSQREQHQQTKVQRRTIFSLCSLIVAAAAEATAVAAEATAVVVADTAAVAEAM